MDENILRKVRGLLRLGQSDNPNESAAAAAMAQKLMDRHAITSDMLELETGEAKPAEEVRSWEEPLGKAGARWRGALAVHLCRANGCMPYRSGKVYHVIGTASGVDAVRYLFAHCVREVNRLSAKHARGNGRTWANNFRLGCVDAIAKAIKTEREALLGEIREEYQGTSALVPLEKAIQRVERDYRAAESFGHVKLGLRGGGSYRVNGHAGARESGRTAGAGIYGGKRSSLGAGQRRIGA